MLTDTLCTACGLCCDGTLLGDVELTGLAEAARLEVLGLDVDDDEIGAELLPLPCAALCGTRCRIYAHRPKSCRQFECRLLQDVRRGRITVEQSLSEIARARAQVRLVETLLSQLETDHVRMPLQERYTEAMAEACGSGSEPARVCETLEAAMTALSRTIRTSFLGPERSVDAG